VGTISELLTFDHPWVHEYFAGPRGRAAIRDTDHGAGKTMETA